jgi:hypothetical protein
MAIGEMKKGEGLEEIVIEMKNMFSRMKIV